MEQDVKSVGPAVIIDHMVLYTLLGQDDFYVKVPVFHFLKQTGQDTVKSIVNAAVDAPKAEPGRLNVRSMMQPAFAAFTKEAFAVSQSCMEALYPLLDYMEEKRGVRPSSVLLFRNGPDGIEKLVIEQTREQAAAVQ